MSNEKITDKAKDIEFSVPGNARVRRSSGLPPLVDNQPAVLAQVNDATSPLAKENRNLKDQIDVLTVTTIEWRDKSTKIEAERDDLATKLVEFDGANIAKRLDPKLVKQSLWANRNEASFENQDFKDLVIEIESSGGNVQPIKVRPIAGSSPQMYEIVFGHRRHRACLMLEIPVLAMIESLDDKALFVEMDRENRQRADLTVFEQGVMYQRALDTKVFAKAADIARASGVSDGNLSTALNLLKLPEEVLRSFQSPLDIRFKWATQLIKLNKESPGILLARAKDVIALRNTDATVNADMVFQLLTKPSENRNSAGSIDRSISVNGTAVASIKSKGRRVIVDIGLKMDLMGVDELEKAIVKILSTRKPLP